VIGKIGAEDKDLRTAFWMMLAPVQTFALPLHGWGPKADDAYWRVLTALWGTDRSNSGSPAL